MRVCAYNIVLLQGNAAHVRIDNLSCSLTDMITASGTDDKADLRNISPSTANHNLL